MRRSSLRPVQGKAAEHTFLRAMSHQSDVKLTGYLASVVHAARAYKTPGPRPVQLCA